MPSTTIKYFAYLHLPAHLQNVSRPLGEMADKFEQLLPDGPEKSAGMRKLLEAKDCFVRAALDLQKPAPTETKTYADGSTATGPAPLPDVSPDGAPALPPHQQRVVAELEELSDRMDKLMAFFNTDIFTGLDSDEQLRLRAQLEAMDLYGGALKARIKVFAPAIVGDWPDKNAA